MNLYPHPIKTHLIRMNVIVPSHVQLYDLDDRHMMVFVADGRCKADFSEPSP